MSDTEALARLARQLAVDPSRLDDFYQDAVCPEAAGSPLASETPLSQAVQLIDLALFGAAGPSQVGSGMESLQCFCLLFGVFWHLWASVRASGRARGLLQTRNDLLIVK